VKPGFEPVAEAFEGNFGERGELGAAFAAVVDGETVVDLWGGTADSRQRRAWQAGTLIGVFSGSKGLVATCMSILVERGKLALDVPVCEYWPEFAAEGKERITVGDVLVHEAGLPGLDTAVSIEEATDALTMARLVAAQRPTSAPGAGPRYHAITFGWICGELVRRVDGRSIGRFLHEEVAVPLGLDAWIGLPASRQGDVAYLERGEEFARRQDEVVLDRDEDPLAWSIWSNPPRFSEGEMAANLRVWRAAEVPATSGVATARSLARLYCCLARGGEIDGVRLLAPATMERMRRRVARGQDPYVGEVAFAGGFEAQGAELHLGLPADAFGHDGAGGSVHGAWPSLRTGFSYTPNLLQSLDGADPRASALLDALHAAVTAS
jgi:CubicO group peptidase (beta-lactamase class C family)